MTDNTGIRIAPLEKTMRRVLAPFESFIARQSSSGILLMLTTALALVAANTAFAPSYYALQDTPVMVGIGSWGLNKPMLLWVNDLLMALFFFVVGLELKRELLFGELASPRKAALPLVAAVGGMVVPALIYWAFNHGQPTIGGWAIPMATDIAFAIGVLVLLGDRVPRALMAMLVAIAIVDDLGAVLVIAIFYTSHLQLHYLVYAGVATLAMFILNRAGVRAIAPYFLLAMALWYVMLKSGVHPTLAGVIGAFMLPASSRYNPHFFNGKNRNLMEQFERSYHKNPELMKNTELREVVSEMECALKNVSTPSQRLEHFWHLPVAYLVIPIFAFFNAGISLSPADLMEAATNPVFEGVFYGLLVGKFVGIFGFTWLCVRSGLLQLPDGLRLGHVAGLALVAGIGFTMSIFISALAFENEAHLLTMAKAGIFAASLAAGGLGAATLYMIAGKSKS